MNFCTVFRFLLVALLGTQALYAAEARYTVPSEEVNDRCRKTIGLLKKYFPADAMITSFTPEQIELLSLAKTMLQSAFNASTPTDEEYEKYGTVYIDNSAVAELNKAIKDAEASRRQSQEISNIDRTLSAARSIDRTLFAGVRNNEPVIVATALRTGANPNFIVNDATNMTILHQIF